jgi:hypothetical protein
MSDIALSYSTTIPRELVHRAATAEVFLTDHAPATDGTYLIAGQLPRAHSYYNDHTTSPALYDPLLILESFRQGAILVSHAYLGAPDDSSFIFDSGSLEVLDVEALRIGAEPGRTTVRHEITEEKRRGGRVAGAVFDACMNIDGRLAATTRLTCRWVPRTTWGALRSRARAGLDLTPRAHLTGLRLPSYAVGRRSAQNVVLAEAAVSGGSVIGKVAVDRSHPGLFDHPLDHVPGALMFEAFRQTALFAATELQGLAPRSLSVTRMETEFRSVGEFELPTECSATVREVSADGTVFLDLTMRQEDTVVATARLELSRVSPTPPAGAETPADLVTAC